MMKTALIQIQEEVKHSFPVFLLCFCTFKQSSFCEGFHFNLSPFSTVKSLINCRSFVRSSLILVAYFATSLAQFVVLFDTSLTSLLKARRSVVEESVELTNRSCICIRSEIIDRALMSAILQ